MGQPAAETRGPGSLALALGGVGIGACVSLIVFFVVGGPFGFINDVGNAALAVVAAALAVRWLRSTEIRSTTSLVATTLAVLGMAVAIVGSVLVIFDITGYFLAGLVSAVGFALIGSWLVAVNRARTGSPLMASPGRARLGVVAGAVMAIGFVNVPAIFMGLDDMDAAPDLLLAAGICWMGTYLLMPIWSIWLSRGSHPSDAD